MPARTPVEFTGFTEAAVLAATSILTKPKTIDFRAVLLSLTPFVETVDLPGSLLVMESWMAQGTPLVDLVKFARDNKHDEDIRPVLDWLRDILNPNGPAGHSYKMDELTKAAHSWIEDNKVS